jgi:predicted small lipoprotein YifL
MKRLASVLFALIAVTALLSGCGQKGPLYHPDDEKAGNSHDVFVF